MAEEKEPEKEQPKKEEKPKSKKWCFCLVFLGLAIIVFLGWRTYVYFGSGSNQSSTPKPAASKNYTYHEPSTEAKNRQIDCMSTVFYRMEKKNALCLNLYQISAEDIQEKLSSSSYDRVIVYGEKIIVDGNPNTGMTDFSQKLYRVAKFTDQITVPKLMEYYGVEDLNYITQEFAPYPAIYVYIDTVDEIAQSCRSDALGCGLAHFGLQANDSLLNNTTNGVYFLARPNTQDTLRLEIKKPSDCYTNGTLIHEIGHVLTNANQSTLQGSKLSLKYVPTWFDEAQAELTGTIGPDWVCGTGTVKTTECLINGKSAKDCDLVKFNNVYPPAGNHTKFPSENPCDLAMINEFYKFLGSGDLESQHSKFFTALRTKTKVKDLSSDEVFMNYILEFLGNSQSVKDNLSSHGCGI